VRAVSPNPEEREKNKEVRSIKLYNRREKKTRTSPAVNLGEKGERSERTSLSRKTQFENASEKGLSGKKNGIEPLEKFHTPCTGGEKIKQVPVLGTLAHKRGTMPATKRKKVNTRGVPSVGEKKERALLLVSNRRRKRPVPRSGQGRRTTKKLKSHVLGKAISSSTKGKEKSADANLKRGKKKRGWDARIKKVRLLTRKSSAQRKETRSAQRKGGENQSIAPRDGFHYFRREGKGYYPR